MEGVHEALLKRFYGGETLAASRLMSIVERGGDDAETLLTSIHARTGRSQRIALTGGTGSGKSTLVGGLTSRFRRDGRTVGVVAEDPTSPFSGGAILGDRIRMQAVLGDVGVFVRSIASRGSQTGFSALAAELADVLDAFGRDIVLLETIGIGQLEHRIRHAADTTVVVATPESGDEVQTLKSGLMEIGDIFVVNKSDRPLADAFARDLISTLEIRSERREWVPPVVSTVATDGTGIDELADTIERHTLFLARDGRLARRRHEGMCQRIRTLVEEKLSGDLWQNRYIEDEFDGILGQVERGELSPYGAAERLLAVFFDAGSGGTGAS